MKYRVVIESSARSDIDAAYDWIKERAPLAAIKWFNRVDDAIRSLARNPHRCVAAPESVEFEQNIRQLVHGRRAGRYRILFVVEAASTLARNDPPLLARSGPLGRVSGEGAGRQ